MDLKYLYLNFKIKKYLYINKKNYNLFEVLITAVFIIFLFKFNMFV